MTRAPKDPLARFEGVQQVVGDSLRFRRKLGIGEDAYTSLRVGRSLARIWDVGGVAATGAGVAASSTVAGTFFGASGWLATLGLGAAAVTPIGWVVAAAVVSGGAYYGVTRAVGAFSSSRVEVIPCFLNSPIDQLGAALLDMMAALAFKVAHMDGQVDETERRAMADYFVSEWGYDPAYVGPALDLIEQGGVAHPIKPMTEAIARFVEQHPDCNFDAFRKEIAVLLQEVASADGVLDEREELAIAAICSALQPAGLADKVGGVANSVAVGIGGAVGQLTSLVPDPAPVASLATHKVATSLKRIAAAVPRLPFGRKP